jgi:hypothetical protein
LPAVGLLFGLANRRQKLDVLGDVGEGSGFGQFPNQADHQFLVTHSATLIQAPPAGKLALRSINGKRDDFTRTDLLTIAQQHGLKDADDIINQVTAAVTDWPRFAQEAGVTSDQQQTISTTHRLALAEPIAHATLAGATPSV